MRIKHTLYMALILIIFAGLFCPAAFAEPGVSAQSAIMMEKNSGRVLYSKNCDERLPMASTTKIMTAAVALENCESDLDSVIDISDSAAGVEGSSMYLQSGEKMTMRELLYGLMLSSGNDAAVAIAESVGGSQEDFVELMNKKAQEIGATDTHFTNPNGLPDEEHYSTARDMARITAYAMSNSVFSEIVATKNYRIEGEGKAYPRALSNHNRLLKMYEDCVGVKTGFTKAAGRCLVSAANRGGMTLICVTLNAPDDWNDHIQMFDYGYATYRYEKLADASAPTAAVEVNGSYEGVMPIYPETDIYYPLTDGEECVPEIEIYPELSAPIACGEHVGKISFIKNGEREASAALISGTEVALVIKSDVDTSSSVKKFGIIFAERINAIFEEWTNFITSYSR